MQLPFSSIKNDPVRQILPVTTAEFDTWRKIQPAHIQDWLAVMAIEAAPLGKVIAMPPAMVLPFSYRHLRYRGSVVMQLHRRLPPDCMGHQLPIAPNGANSGFGLRFLAIANHYKKMIGHQQFYTCHKTILPY